MKKVLAAALLCSVSSFATWDLFPVQDAGKGEAKVGFQYDIPGEKSSTMGINFGARYSIIEGLEAAVMLGGPGFVLSQTVADIDTKATGLNKPVIGVRYWLLPLGLGLAVDAALPLGSEKVVGKEPQFGLDVGVQYSTKITEELVIGSEALATVINKLDKDNNAGINLNIAVEADYSIGAITPWLAVDLTKGLTKADSPEIDPTLGATLENAAGTATNVATSEKAPLAVGISVGATYDISESMYAQAGFWIGVAGDEYKDFNPKTINVDFGIKF